MTMIGFGCLGCNCRFDGLACSGRCSGYSFCKLARSQQQSGTAAGRLGRGVLWLKLGTLHQPHYHPLSCGAVDVVGLNNTAYAHISEHRTSIYTHISSYVTDS